MSVWLIASVLKVLIRTNSAVFPLLSWKGKIFTLPFLLTFLFFFLSVFLMVRVSLIWLVGAFHSGSVSI